MMAGQVQPETAVTSRQRICGGGGIGHGQLGTDWIDMMVELEYKIGAVGMIGEDDGDTGLNADLVKQRKWCDEGDGDWSTLAVLLG
ncbi:hypothetical protein M0R45_008942 [Rubus argutus]|uniref:Uncharacterized protein n=1 Tax=Rubus argutus TaxID=59490 RepID=A0AAW1Y2Q1_RUBAR